MTHKVRQLYLFLLIKQHAQQTQIYTIKTNKFIVTDVVFVEDNKSEQFLKKMQNLKKSFSILMKLNKLFFSIYINLNNF